jgi:hypothetical protein
LVIVRDVTLPLANSQGKETAVPFATGAELGSVTSVSARARLSIREFLNLHVAIQRGNLTSPLLTVHICSNVVKEHVNKEYDYEISDIYRTLLVEELHDWHSLKLRSD